MLALTNGQRLLVVILFALFVVDVVIWPAIRREPTRRDDERERHRRLMQEIRRQDRE